MSFIVSFKGQFQPYPLPDLSHYDRVRNVYKAKGSHQVKDHEDHPLEEAKSDKGQRKHSQGISAYQKSDSGFQKERIPHQAKDIMSTSIKLIHEDHTYQDAVDLMKKFGFRHLPVINDDNTLVGIVSEKDLLSATSSQRVSAIMTEKVLTCLDTTRLQDVAKIMLHEKLGALPVVNEKYLLVGIVTQTDILQFVTGIMSINDLF